MRGVQTQDDLLGSHIHDWEKEASLDKARLPSWPIHAAITLVEAPYVSGQANEVIHISYLIAFTFIALHPLVFVYLSLTLALSSAFFYLLYTIHGVIL